jgi:N-acetylgalactosamine kinase
VILTLEGLLGWLQDRPAADKNAAAFEGFLNAGYAFPGDRARILARYRGMLRGFASRFQSGQVAIARAPGRVNLIGEHTDYNGLPVLPMAVNRDLAAVFAPRPDATVVLANTDAAFAERSFELQVEIPPYPTGDWGNYAKAAVQGLMEHYRRKGRGLEKLRGFQATVNGDIPAAAGMSSSSALVVLCALMFLAANGLEIRRLELAELLARAEHYVGTQGGGMDQAISLMGRPGEALKIEFFPLRVQPTGLPQGYAVVVANSLVQAAKTAEALDKYNRRPIECRLATAVLRKAFSERHHRDVPLQLLGDLRQEKLAIRQSEIQELAERVLHPEPYRLAEIASLLGRSPETTARSYCRRRDGSIFPEPPEGFELWKRYRHVTEEGARVERSFEALQAGEIEEFGRLMCRSHESCRDLYEISCPELDRLVAIALEAGALGSRLTGAGFGGCTVSLVEESGLQPFLSHVARAYYREYLKGPGEELGPILFPCRAVAGASVLGG